MIIRKNRFEINIDGMVCFNDRYFFNSNQVINNMMIKKAYKYRDGFAVYDRTTIGMDMDNIAKDIISNK